MSINNQHVVADALRLELETWDGEPRAEAGEVIGVIFGGTDDATLAVPASEAVALLATQQLAPTAG